MPLKKSGPYSDTSGTTSFWEDDPYFDITLDDDFSTLSDIFDPDIQYKYKERKVKKPSDFFLEKDLSFRDYEKPSDTFETIFDNDVDYSLGALLYLQALGYKECIWYLNESHPEYDICDELYGQTVTIDFLIENARNHAALHDYYPPSPIFACSHPGCRCYIACIGPSSADSIPDKAPGLPINGSREELLEYKKKIFPNLVTIHIDHVTFPPSFHSARNGNNRKKKGDEERPESSIVPVKINKSFIASLPMGFYRPLLKDYKGIQVETREDISKVYLVDLNRVLAIPDQHLTILKLKETPEKKIACGTFAKVDGKLAIINRVLENGNTFGYLPESNHSLLLTDFIILRDQ